MTEPLRVVVDCRYTTIGRHNGISRYGARVAEALGRLASVTMLVKDERQLELLPDLPWVRVHTPVSWREPFVAREVNRLEPDVVFSPMQIMGSWRRRYGLVLTLHDLIYYTQRTPPRDLPWIVRVMWRLYHLAWWPQRVLLNTADAVVTVSETTRRLIAEHRLTRRPVVVVPNAADHEEVARAVPTTRDLVYMGSFMPYKNVETLAAALHELPGYRLHLMSALTEAERARLEPLAPAGSLVLHDGATDEEYRELLGRAHALLSASLDEGFGIPVVEAMSAGTPVVVSDIPVFREIGGDAAAYVDPRDPSAFARAVRLLEDPQRWLVASEAARAQAARYDWDASAEILLETLREVVARRAAR